MKLRLSATLVVFAAALWTLQSPRLRSQAGNSLDEQEEFQGRPAVAHEVLVRVRPGAALGPLHALTDAADSKAIGSRGWRRIRSSSRLVQELVSRLRGRSDVIDVEPNYIVQATTVPNDSMFGSLWGLLNTPHPGADIHATSAWDIVTGSTANVIGVVDSGVDYTHPDLAANMWSAPDDFTVTLGGNDISCLKGSHGFNAILRTCDPQDDFFHGTHVAGTIGAVGNNASGVVGVNWATRIMALKFLDATGHGSTADAVNAIDFAIKTKAYFAAHGGGANVRVLSNSWGGGAFASSLGDEITAAGNAEMLFVAAAGNSASNNDIVPAYPASYPQNNVIAVAATNETDGLASFSNYGATSVDLAAPGNNIYSTIPGSGFFSLSGTSMATPHVSGAAMLILSACGLNTIDLKKAILDNVDPLASLTGLMVTGGRLNVDRAVRSCATVPTVSLTSPADASTFAAAAPVPLAASASDVDGIERVEFYQRSSLAFAQTVLLGTSKAAPYSFTWNNAPIGQYTITAKAYDTFGTYALSPPVHLIVNGATQATFNRIDTTLQGNWIGSRGVEGGIIAGETPFLPAHVTVTTAAPTLTWAASTTDVRALWKSSMLDRIAAAWSSSGTVAMDVNMADGLRHIVDMYLVDWDNAGRIVRVDVHDAATDALLDSRTVSSFAGGAYVEWMMQGHVRIDVVNVSGPNAIVSGLFLNPLSGAAPPTRLTITSPTDWATYTAPASIPLSMNAVDNAVGLNRVEFYQGTNLIATSTNGTDDGRHNYTATWSGVAPGTYALIAKAYRNVESFGWPSAPVHVTVTGPSSSATFQSTDTTTKGSWRGVYGSEGAVVVNDSTALPAYATLTTSAANWTWAASTADVRALQKKVGTDRIAATWYSAGTAAVDVNLTDGAGHRVSLYLVDWDGMGRTERVEVRDAASNALLDSRTVSGFVGGTYLTWTMQGHVVVNVMNVVGVNAVVSGVFFDSGVGGNAPPVVTLMSPTEGASFTAPAAIALAATASDGDGINRVEFYQGSTLIASSTNGQGNGTVPYTATWANVSAGTYTLTAKAYDASGSGLSTVSDPVHVTVTIPGGTTSATFFSIDTTTAGTWKGTYGTDGAVVVNDSTTLPPYATLTMTAPNWTWAASTSDVRALQKSVGADRLAATWYGYAMALDVNIVDGGTHRVSLYLLDWDNGGRVERLEVRDASSNTLLDSRTISGFTGGQYVSWMIQGHVTINVIYVSGPNAVFSGVFFDSGSGNAPPTVTLTAPSEGASYTAPASIALAATASDSDGIDRVEFYQGSTLVTTSVNGSGNGTIPYTATWSNVAAGNYTLTAKAYDASSGRLSTVSGPVHVTVTTAGGGSTSAVFVGTDATTQGTWRGTYGVDGAIVVNDSTQLPTYATVTTTAPNWTWAASTSDVRALQKSAGPDRLAATWYGYTMGLDINIVDGGTHRVSLYLLDWDNGGRVERLEVRDATSNALLDSRTMSGFTGGQYVSWMVQGHVTINVIYVSGTNAVVSGLFFGQ